MEWLDGFLRQFTWFDTLYVQGNPEWVPLALYASAGTLVVALLAAALRSRALALVTLAAAIATGVIGYQGWQTDLVPVAEMQAGMPMEQEWAQERIALMEDMAFHPMRGALFGALGGGFLGLLALGLGIKKARR